MKELGIATSEDTSDDVSVWGYTSKGVILAPPLLSKID